MKIKERRVVRPVKLLMVDDHTLVRAGTRALLEATGQITVIGEAATGEEALERLRTQTPDIVLMDANMPGIGGLETTRKLLRTYPRLRIVVLTMHSKPLYLGMFLEAGSVGYLTKECQPEEIVAGVLTVADGGRYIGAAIAQQLALSLRPHAGANPFERVTPRELQVMMMLVRGYGTREIASQLSITTKTVSSHRCNIYEKLGVDNDVALLHLAIRHQMVEPGDCC